MGMNFQSKQYITMRTKTLLLLIPILLLTNFRPAFDPISSSERKVLIGYLKSSKKDLLKSIEGLTEEQLNFKSNPESWSVAECVEHIAISEHNLFEMIQNTLKGESNPGMRKEVKLSDDDVYKAITDRSHKVKTQEAFEPTGRFGSHEATVKAFLTKRDLNIEYAKTTKDDLRDHFFTFPSEALGTLDAYQLIIFLAAHSKRHTLQIEEVKSNPEFPNGK